jgi:hypothetical protein
MLYKGKTIFKKKKYKLKNPNEIPIPGNLVMESIIEFMKVHNNKISEINDFLIFVNFDDITKNNLKNLKKKHSFLNENEFFTNIFLNKKEVKEISLIETWRLV